MEIQLELEKKGILLPAAPMDPFDKTKTRTGRIIVRENSFEEADDIAKNDPMYTSGLYEYGIWKWSLNVGSFGFTINNSDQSVSIE